MALSVSHPVSTLNQYWCLGLIRDVIRKEPYNTGADPGFQVRGGGAHLKKLRRAGGGISCEKSRFYAKK
jgi:hypothetical protein